MFYLLEELLDLTYCNSLIRVFSMSVHAQYECVFWHVCSSGTEVNNAMCHVFNLPAVGRSSSVGGRLRTGHIQYSLFVCKHCVVYILCFVIFASAVRFQVSGDYFKSAELFVL